MLASGCFGHHQGRNAKYCGSKCNPRSTRFGEEGESINEPLARSGVFNDIVVNMIKVGEETGELDKMLVKIADNYDEEVDEAVGAMMALMEPILIVFMGGAVGFIVIALFLPLIKIISEL